MPKILRLTLFKIPNPAHVQEAIAKYATLPNDAVKDGKPYIQMAAANHAHDDPRNKGYTLVARTVFASKEDMDFYDNECAAHGEIKATLKAKVVDGPPLVLYMDA
ncbi:hypothetical protein P280DRAFT_395276 [Massarina eburnea CBS 473.64]|uniref:Stress-response A/B barrel domain-containing protein n=1 Tax=Massarina eburnea CBS 473.64 TaxID=1395130 RepID=A0A6A6S3U1_9PLEO|nr:hypothetical protein P280DRAFT_395276 [Massarina eburnea CBS 473.64]